MAIKAHTEKFEDMTHEERMERLEELKQVRIEYLRYRAKYHLEAERDAKDYLSKVNHWRMFSMYNHLLMQEKYGKDYTSD